MPAEEKSRLEEVEVWWGGYAVHALLPEFLLTVIVTVGIFLVAHELRNWDALPNRAPRYLADAAMALLWCVQIPRWLHTLLATNYHLTNRRIFHIHTMLMPPNDSAFLHLIREVRVQRTWVERQLGTGRIRIEIADRAKPMILKGVRDPNRVAQIIRKQVQAFTTD